jgi:TP901 family phage tail tape measure protein
VTNVGYATLSVIPSLRGFRSAVTKGTTSAMSGAGTSAGRSFSGAFTKAAKLGALGGLGAAFGIGSFIKDSVELEAAYSKTMAQMRVATKAPAKELQRLDDLAIRLGKETVFSAVDASDAMLELAKNGIKPATIEAGALSSALTLAAAGSTGLEESAQVMGNTLNAFRLKGDKAASVSAALAGAANASSASVASLAEGLQQSSASAADAGFNVQETTGILAAFANAGISGSDAGTSLKTMLTRLVPSTRKASNAMRKYGLDFTDANGEFKSAVEIAENLKKGLGDLSDEERSAALNTIFGSDARRAATILTREGADGLAKYIKATSDQGAAEEMAKANMEGTAGAIERLKGAWETAKLEFGKSIAPVAADFLDFLSENIDDVAPKLVEFGDWFAEDGVDKIKQFKNFVEDDVLPIMKDIGDFASDAAGFIGDLSGAFDKLPNAAKLSAIAALLGGGGALKLRGGGGGLLGGLGKAAGLSKPIPVFVTNPGFGGGTGGAGSKGATIGKGVAKSLPPVLVIGGLAYAVDSLILDPARKDATRLEPTRQAFDSTLSFIEGAENKAKGFGTTLDLVGAKKVEPKFAVPGLAKSQEGLEEFLRLQLAAGKPITPYINTSPIERAIALLKTMNSEIQRNAVPTAGTTGGIGYQHGGGASTAGNGRAPNIHIENMQPHDYNDFLSQTQRRAQQAGLGGVGR